MEKTIDERLLEKLHQLRRGRRHGHGRPEGSMGMKGHGCEHGPHEGHGMRRFMSPERGRVLTALLEAEKDGIRQKDLLAVLTVQPSTLSETIDKLEADRYVERTVDPEDRRATLICLTEKGKARAYEMMDARRTHAAEVFKNLSDEEKQQLLALLEKITPAA